MSYYTDKVFGSSFLSRSKGLEDMLVRDQEEVDRPQLPESRLRLMEARLEETALEPRTRLARREGEMLEPGASSRMSSRIPLIYSRTRIHEQPTSRKSVTFSQTTEQAVNSRVPTDYSNSSFISNSSSRLNLSPRGLVTLRERREEVVRSDSSQSSSLLVRRGRSLGTTEIIPWGQDKEASTGLSPPIRSILLFLSLIQSQLSQKSRDTS